MTKYEWETELRKNVHRLPDEEIRRVLEYYDELFADKIERGYTESEIVGQFGNPVDVADKILSEYEGELEGEREEVPPPVMGSARDTANEREDAAQEKKTEVREIAWSREDTPPPPHKTEPEGKLRGERLVIFLLINVLTGFAVFFAVGAVWIAAAALTVAGGAIAVGGVAGTVMQLVQVLRGLGGAAWAQLGMCVALCGAGILLTVACVWGVKLLYRLTKAAGVGVRNWLCPA